MSRYSAHSSVDTNPDAAAADWNDIRNDEDESTTATFDTTTTKIVLETEKDIVVVVTLVHS